MSVDNSEENVSKFLFRMGVWRGGQDRSLLKMAYLVGFEESDK